MIKYLTTAVVLKIFSVNSITCNIYRRLGNSFGQKKRKNQCLESYIERGDLFIRLCKKYSILEKDNRFLELGTGWLHWFGIYARLHEDIKVDLYDVWDNRQFGALKSSFNNLKLIWDKSNRTTEEQNKLFATIKATNSQHDLYKSLNFVYTINKEGALSDYDTNSFDCVFSFHVMEHISRSFIAKSINDMYRILKPGAYCIHQIGIDDHLSHYDKKESLKKYLNFSMRARKMLFENVVQYHNVLQGQEFLDMFSEAGFEIVEVDREKCDISNIKVHSDWGGFSNEDLETTILTVICRKPYSNK